MTRKSMLLASILTWSLFCYSSTYADEQNHSKCTPDYEECIGELVIKIYLNPERVICEGDSNYLALNEDKVIELSNLQRDERGYFIEFNPQLDEELLQYVFGKIVRNSYLYGSKVSSEPE